MSIENIMMNSVGLMEDGETLLNRPKRHFNKDRYIELYSELSNSYIKSEAESKYFYSKALKLEHEYKMAEMKNDKASMAAFSEDMSELADKLRRKATDLWRTIKELLAKLILFIEEKLSYLFNRADVARKIALKLADSINKIAQWSSTTAYGTVRFTPGYSGKEGLTLPITVDRFVIDWINVSDDLNISDAEKKQLASAVDRTFKLQSKPDAEGGNDGNSEENIMNVLSSLGIRQDEAMSLSDFKSSSSSNNLLDSVNLGLFRAVSFWNDRSKSDERKMSELSKQYSSVAKLYKETKRYIKKGTFQDEYKIDPGVYYDSEGKRVKSGTIGMTDDTIDTLAGAINAKSKTSGTSFDFTKDNEKKVSFVESVKEIKNLYTPTKRKPTTTSSESITQHQNAKTNYVYSGTYGNGDLDLINAFIMNGVIFETIKEVLKMKKFARRLNLTINKQKVVFDNDYVKTLISVYNDACILFFYQMLCIRNFENMRELYFRYKKKAIELKNAPTEITDNYPKEVLKGVNLIISRSTKAGHLILKDFKDHLKVRSNTSLFAVEALEKLNKILLIEADE